MKIIIPGDPVSQARMKYSSRGGFGRLYDPRKKEKDSIKKGLLSYIQSHYTGFKHLQHPRVSFIFHMRILSSTRKRDLPLFSSGLLKHENKPDVDNLVKLYLDCLDGIAFEGDQGITLGTAMKLYHPFPKTVIILQETQQVLSPLEVDPLTWYALFGKECGTGSCDQMDALSDSYTPTQLAGDLSCGMSCLRQTLGTSEPVPTAQSVLAASELRLQQAKIRKASAG